VTTAIHRVIEQHAATRGDLPAIVDSHRTCSYRELNATANGIARQLMARGLRRCGHVHVVMRPGVDLGIVLLAVLKAGGCYTWTNPDTLTLAVPNGVSISVGGNGIEDQYRHVDVASLLSEPAAHSANLPILSRGTDIACVLEDGTGAPAVLVPHDTITTLRSQAVTHPTKWTGEPGAFELWLALMAGTTAIVEDQAAAVAVAAA
jgi:non-ribosomal peptide synthetase component F